MVRCSRSTTLPLRGKGGVSEVGEYAVDVVARELDRPVWDGVAARWGGDVFGDPPSICAAVLLDGAERVAGGEVGEAGREFRDAGEDALGQGPGVLRWSSA
jgi:hypothetical protein